MSGNRIRQLLYGIGTAVWLLSLSLNAGAALDTSGPFICAFTQGFDCDSEEGCQTITPRATGLPEFVRIDIANKKVTTVGGQKTGDNRETAIRGVYEAEGKLFLQGVERRGWSAVIDRDTGQMTLSAADNEEAIVFFGQCTAP